MQVLFKGGNWVQLISQYFCVRMRTPVWKGPWSYHGIAQINADYPRISAFDIRGHVKENIRGNSSQHAAESGPPFHTIINNCKATITQSNGTTLHVGYSHSAILIRLPTHSFKLSSILDSE